MPSLSKCHMAIYRTFPTKVHLLHVSTFLLPLLQFEFFASWASYAVSPLSIFGALEVSYGLMQSLHYALQSTCPPRQLFSHLRFEAFLKFPTSALWTNNPSFVNFDLTMDCGVLSSSSKRSGSSSSPKQKRCKSKTNGRFTASGTLPRSHSWSFSAQVLHRVLIFENGTWGESLTSMNIFLKEPDKIWTCRHMQIYVDICREMQTAVLYPWKGQRWSFRASFSFTSFTSSRNPPGLVPSADLNCHRNLSPDGPDAQKCPPCEHVLRKCFDSLQREKPSWDWDVTDRIITGTLQDFSVRFRYSPVAFSKTSFYHITHNAQIVQNG